MQVSLGVARSDSTMPSSRGPLLFVVNVGWFFLSHRLPLAIAAKRAGFDVHVAAATESSAEADAICQAGLTFHILRGGRGRRGLWEEAQQFQDVLKVIRRVQPVLVHAVTAKPIIFAGIAARLAHGPALIGALTGLGYLYVDDRRSRTLRKLVNLALRLALRSRSSRLILQNEHDLKLMVEQQVVPPERAVLIKGSGVDLASFPPSDETESPPTVVLPARMLRDKGIIEFTRAAVEVRRVIPHVRMILVGRIDPQNPAALRETELRALCESSGAEWWGHVADIKKVFDTAHVVCLPSYREGLPKALIEAAAVGRAIVTTDVPGCRDVIEHEVSGLLVPPGDSVALANALVRLLQSKELRRRLSEAARARVQREFSLDIVVRKTLSVYDEVLINRQGGRNADRRRSSNED